MAVVVNARDLKLQANQPRVLPVNLPSNVTVPVDQVPGLPDYYTSAKAVYLNYPSQVFRVAKNGTVSPENLSFEATLKNLSGTVGWNVVSGNASLTLNSATPSVAVLSNINMVSDTVTIRAYCVVSGTTYSDEVTVVRLREGIDSISSFLSNEAHTLQADSSGVVSSFAGAATTMYMFVGSQDDTANWTYTASASSGVVHNLSNSVCTVTGMSVLNGYIDITAAKSGMTSVTKRFVLTKSKSGSNGTNGTNGTNGYNGSDGRRGTVTVAISGYSWSDSTATSAITGTTGTSPIDRDIVTISAPGFSVTKFYSSGSWITADAYINGNMIVSGTFSADMIYGGTLDGIVLKAGSGNSPSGRAFEVNGSGGVFADSLGVGIVSAQNVHFNGSAVQATTFRSAPAITGDVYFSAANQPDAHGLRGSNSGKQKSGAVGTAYGYAFYAEQGTYGPFTGAHDVLVPLGEALEPGDIMVDLCCVTRKGLSDTLFAATTSTMPRQKTAIGVFTEFAGLLSTSRPAAFMGKFVTGIDPAGHKTRTQFMTEEYDECKDMYQHALVNALGEGQINVCGLGGDIEAGDYITTSAMPGKGMRQEDDLVRSYTVAKAREPVIFDGPDDVKQVACIYLCG